MMLSFVSPSIAVDDALLKDCNHKGTHKFLSTMVETDLDTFLMMAGVPAL